MNETKPTTGKYALTFGLILGAVSVVFALMLYSLDLHYQGGMMVFGVSIVLMIAAVLIGMIQFRQANNGFMSFGEGLKIGVGICLIAGVIGIIFNQLLMNVIDPEMMSKAMEFQRSELLANTKMTPDQISTQIEAGKKFSTPTFQILFGLLFSVILGFILSLVPALVLKKQENLN